MQSFYNRFMKGQSSSTSGVSDNQNTTTLQAQLTPVPEENTGERQHSGEGATLISSLPTNHALAEQLNDIDINDDMTHEQGGQARLQQPPAGRRGTFTSMLSSFTAPVLSNFSLSSVMSANVKSSAAPSANSDNPSSPTKEEKEKAEQEAAHRKAEEAALAERQRLESEPEVAKALRRTFINMQQLLSLLEEIAMGSRFLPVGCHRFEDARVLLEQELAQDSDHRRAFESFFEVSVPDWSQSVFEKLQHWSLQFSALSELWEDVFMTNLPSVQPLFKLNFFYDVLNKFLVISPFEKVFHHYMVESQSSISSDNEAIMQNFITTIELFIARAVILYEMLDQFKTHIQDIDAIRQECGAPPLSHIEFKEFEQEDYTAEDIDDKNLPEELIQERNQAKIDYDKTVAEMTAVVKVIDACQQRLVLIDDGQEIKEDVYETLDGDGIEQEIKTLEKEKKTLAAELHEIGDIVGFDEKACEKQERKAHIMVTMGDLESTIKRYVDALNRNKSIKKRGESIVLTKEQIEEELGSAQETKIILEKQIQEREARFSELSTDVYIKKQEIAQQRNEDKKTRKERQEAQEIFFEQFKIQRNEARQCLTDFLKNMAKQSALKGLVTLSKPIQASVSDTSIQLLRVFLNDYKDFFDEETLFWIGSFITHKTRFFTVKMTVDEEGAVELKLENRQHDMLSDFFISLHKSPRGSLFFSGEASTTEKIIRYYGQLIEESHKNSLLPQGMSDKNLQLIKLLEMVRNSRKEYYSYSNDTTNLLSRMSKTTIPLLGLFVLISKTLSKTSRLRQSILDVSALDLGYDLDAAELLYNEINQPISKISSAPEKASAFTTRASIFEEISKPASNNVLDILDYLFADQRTESDLATDRTGKYPYRNIKLNETEGNALVQELKSPHYMSELQALIKIPEVEDIKHADPVKKSETKTQHNIGRKRLKRLAELLNQLPSKNRFELVVYPVIQLIMIKELIMRYQRKLTDEKSSELGKFAAKLTSGKKSSLLSKLDLLRIMYEDICYMYVANQQPSNTNLQRHALAEVYSDSKKIPKSGIQNAIESGYIKPWFDNEIIDKDSKELIGLFGWFTNAQLQFFLASIGPDFWSCMKSLREKNGDSVEQFDKAIFVNLAKREDKSAASSLKITSFNQLLILLASQRAILTFATDIRETDNAELIVESVRHNWFLQLRFLELILVQQGKLPEYHEGYDAKTNRIRERNMLKLFEKLIDNHAYLAEWLVSAFSKGRADIITEVGRKSQEALTIAAYHLLSVFFKIIFTKEVMLAASEGRSNDARFLLELANHFTELANMTGLLTDDSSDSVLFAMAVYMISSHTHELGLDRSIQIVEENAPNSGNLHKIKDPENDRRLFVSFSSTTQGVEIYKIEECTPRIFSCESASWFANSIKDFETVEARVAIRCAMPTIPGVK